MAVTIELKRTAKPFSHNDVKDIVLADGEPLYSKDDKQLVIGNGSSTVSALPRFYAKTWGGDVIDIAHGGTGNSSGYVRAGLKTGFTSGSNSTSEGQQTAATGTASHAEGQQTTATSTASHAEGIHSIAENSASHAEGQYTTAQGIASHAEGIHSIAENSASHASGYYTHAAGYYSTARG